MKESEEMKEQEINKLVEETLQSLDKIKRAKANNIATDKIISNIHNIETQSKVTDTINIRVIYRTAAAILLVFSLNIFTFLHLSKIQKKTEKQYNVKSIESINKMFENNNDDSIN